CHCWLGRKLEYCCLLTCDQIGQEHKLPVCKLQRIVMCVRLVLIDLPEDSCGLINGGFPAEGPARMATYVCCKGYFRSRGYTDGHIGVFRCSEPGGERVELTSCEFVTNLGRS